MHYVNLKQLLELGQDTLFLMGSSTDLNVKRYNDDHGSFHYSPLQHIPHDGDTMSEAGGTTYHYRNNGATIFKVFTDDELMGLARVITLTMNVDDDKPLWSNNDLKSA